ncbi:hypothetical protein ACIBSV_40680 [Embleya sp. NPDC050154]|uniref:hypothetical protein n=1 Tax=unclassified Embleya TaxID=2699296 RepID=UPI00379A2136
MTALSHHGVATLDYVIEDLDDVDDADDADDPEQGFLVGSFRVGETTSTTGFAGAGEVRAAIGAVR